MIPILIFIAILIASVALNWFLIEVKKVTPNHKNLAVYRTAPMLINALVFFPSFPEWLWFLVAQICMFALPFNIILNLLRKKPVLYLGEKPKNDGDYSRIDNLMHQYGGPYWFFLFWLYGAGISIIINIL